MKNGIEKRGSNFSYAIRIPDLKTGKTKVKKVGGFKTEQEAKVARAKALVSISGGTYIEPSKITVEDFLRGWIDNHSHSLKPLTEESYRKNIENYLIPHIGRIPLSKLRPTHVQKMYGDLFTTGGKSGTGLSARTVQYSGAVLSKALKNAVEVEGILNINVATRVSTPKGPSKKLEPYSKDEMKALLAGLSEHRLFALFRLATYSGARLGEIVSLRWSDLDFDAMKLSISKNRVRIVGKSIEQNSTKGGDGRRVISLDPVTIEFLRTHRKAQLKERLIAGSEWTESNHLFVNEFGIPIDNSTPSHILQKYRKRLGLREQRFHDLRHFHATQSLRAGLALHVVAQRLGHRDAMVTATIYAHVTSDQAENASLIFARAVE
jgi:integrase